MGVGGNFWDLLKPYARHEGFGFLRNKRVAVDLSYWIVQHETAIKAAHARKPHLRLTFFRTINLFSKFGAFPVFVVDGTPSSLKSRARITRFLQTSGIDPSSFPTAEGGDSVERNGAFKKCVKECAELLELLGIPVLEAKGEAEALCAQLNSGGFVEACITADSDAFLYGAKCVIKCIRPNSKEPLECYCMSDIEAGLGLKRNHLIAIALLVGNDHDLNGVHGVGLDTAIRFAKSGSEEEILKRLDEIASGQRLLFDGDVESGDDRSHLHSSDEISPNRRQSHCSFCGHPGSKRAHFKSSCAYCINGIGDGCTRKPEGFRCDCAPCDEDRKMKELKKRESWQMKVCSKIALRSNFPYHEIMEMYLSNNHGYFDENEGPHMSWESPKIEMLIDFLSLHQNWEPSYIRQKLFSMLSTIYLRDKAMDRGEDLLHGQYAFDSIQRVKMRYGHRFFVVKWKRAANDFAGSTIYRVHAEQASLEPQEFDEVEELVDLLDETDVPLVHVDDGNCFLLSDEDMELVRAAFPQEADRFLQEKELKEAKSKRRKSSGLIMEGTESESPKPRGVQLSITEFYKSTKVHNQQKPGDDDLIKSPEKGGSAAKEKRKGSGSNLPKSVRRRLLFK
ncbi:flap endonuclease GEN-like 1 [Punica granatum]|uniref:Flap endonuclease GEN-like 1 n=2 Tax=Punica granatum TaxID=22663 RepID=A0A218XUF4_PUNGR|nr:flap endonuclease GEN-like 1 [Punica granatum]OWM88286.1 hypothetical protein CDL15_Pgr003698 [Punica granatum]PKI46887.1 hypothetical protein CRG98_032698 [Punica granatum]